MAIFVGGYLVHKTPPSHVGNLALNRWIIASSCLEIKKGNTFQCSPSGHPCSHGCACACGHGAVASIPAAVPAIHPESSCRCHAHAFLKNYKPDA